MYNIKFYKDRRGKSPVLDYLRELKNKNDKDSQIKLDKINDYIDTLSIHGKNAGEPYIKHLDGDIWELRPLRDRILFAAWINGGFVLLHKFVKKTRKTPPDEIKRAKRELADFIERSKKYE